tara:strand:- start:1931 stop:3193 length:1263 start_codon:yes stop_codon:yes gene_type:complete
MYKVIVAHPAQQHSYKTAVALKKHNYLFKYVTTVYNKKKSLTRIVIKFLTGNILERANNRRTNELEDSEIKQFCEIESLVLLFLQRVDKNKRIYNFFNRYINKKFNKKLVKYSIKNKIDLIILFDKYASSAFEMLERKDSSIVKVLDCSAPNFVFMNDIFHNYVKTNNIHQYLNEFTSKENIRTKNETIKETNLADFFLSASNFTTKSLMRADIKKNKIYHCPYDIELPLLKLGNETPKDYKIKLRCLFVGRVTYKKGVLELFKAIEKLSVNKFEFTFVGSYDIKDKEISKYKDKYNFSGHISKIKMDEIYRNSDILVFPSLADGFGLSVVEALSYGIPVICSKNTGACDIIKDGFNGFQINAGAEREIYDKLMWFDLNRKELSKMSQNSIESAKNNNKERYSDRIQLMVKDVLRANKIR